MWNFSFSTNRRSSRVSSQSHLSYSASWDYNCTFVCEMKMKIHQNYRGHVYSFPCKQSAQSLMPHVRLSWFSCRHVSPANLVSKYLHPGRSLSRICLHLPALTCKWKRKISNKLQIETNEYLCGCGQSNKGVSRPLFGCLCTAWSWWDTLCRCEALNFSSKTFTSVPL